MENRGYVFAEGRCLRILVFGIPTRLGERSGVEGTIKRMLGLLIGRAGAAISGGWSLADGQEPVFKLFEFPPGSSGGAARQAPQLLDALGVICLAFHEKA